MDSHTSLSKFCIIASYTSVLQKQGSQGWKNSNTLYKGVIQLAMGSCRHAYAELELLNARAAVYVCRPIANYIMLYKVICELLGEHELGSCASL